jgi:3-isopropylmalate/(R)-2-methylmalate dehydratase large subunit
VPAAAAVENVPRAVDGALKPGVTAKDIILALIARSASAAAPARVRIHGLGHSRARYGRAHDGLQHVDRRRRARGHDRARRHHVQYLHGRPFAPKGADWDAAVARWRKLPTDEGATYDRESPSTRCARADDHLRHQSRHGHFDQRRGARSRSVADPLERDSLAKALRTWISKRASRCWAIPSTWCSSEAAPTRASPICARARSVLKGRKVNPNVRVMVVPGSHGGEAQAKPKARPEIFRAAGCDWREPGCSMCIAMNGDQLQPGEYSVSTSNRNFEGRQGKGGRTFLASPLTAAASALTGVVTDVRTFFNETIHSLRIRWCRCRTTISIPTRSSPRAS